MKRGPVFGITIFTGAPCAVQAVGNWGYDFVYLDLEHSSIGIGPEMERQVMAAKLAGVSPLIRLTGSNPVEIRKAIEMGAEGVVIPHLSNKREAEICVQAAKFPPIGKRGAESNVRAANFGGPDFTWDSYIERSNEETLVIPMAENYEFFDNIDEIMSVPGIDAINFGPIDYALSIGATIKYKMDDPKIEKAFETLVSKAKPLGIGVMGPVVPTTQEYAEDCINKGITMLIMGNDMFHFQNACKQMMNECVEPIRNKLK